MKEKKGGNKNKEYRRKKAENGRKEGEKQQQKGRREIKERREIRINNRQGVCGEDTESHKKRHDEKE
jgi:hypothetical protein